jgi:excisionase family DNA binding protein
MKSETEIITVPELSQLLRVHPSTIYRMLHRGELPGIRIASEWRFRREAIVKWLDEHEVKGKS